MHYIRPIFSAIRKVSQIRRHETKKTASPFGTRARIASAAILIACSAIGASSAADKIGTPDISTEAPKQVPLTGLNMSGGEFTARAQPGRYGHDYVYPHEDEIDYFLDRGANVIRLPFLWERLQPEAYGKLRNSELNQLKRIVKHTSKRKAYIVLDLHNYGKYHDQPIGSAEAPADVLADIWTKLSNEFKDNAYVIFGLMNEPVGLPASQWRSAVDETIAAIRATGAENLLLIPGVRWTGAHSWYAGLPGASNATTLSDIADPANNFAIEVHQYLDHNYSGTNAECQHEQIGVDTLQRFTEWARSYKYRAFLGEFGGSTSDVCMAALDNMLRYMDDNADVWMGWTYWAAGGWWGDNYPFNVHPKKKVTGPERDRPQVRVLDAYWGPDD